jgi:hypothetical protein
MNWDQLIPAVVGAAILAASGGYFAGVRRAMKSKAVAPAYDKVKTK